MFLNASILTILKNGITNLEINEQPWLIKMFVREPSKHCAIYFNPLMFHLNKELYISSLQNKQDEYGILLWKQIYLLHISSYATKNCKNCKIKKKLPYMVNVNRFDLIWKTIDVSVHFLASTEIFVSNSFLATPLTYLTCNCWSKWPAFHVFWCLFVAETFVEYLVIAWCTQYCIMTL